MKIKESKISDNYLEFTMELKTLRYMKVMLIPIVIGALGTVPKGLQRGLVELEIKGRE